MPLRGSLVLALVVAGCSRAPKPPDAKCPVVTPTAAPVDAGAPILVGAGDIGDCTDGCTESTGALLDRIGGTVFAAGDLAYEDGDASDFADCYDPGWGRHKVRTRPAVGNHEYHVEGAADYFAYWGAVAGTAGEGWYSFDLAGWHVVVLNSHCGEVGCGPGSPQLEWLEADLAASGAACTAAIFHHARYSSGDHGGHPSVVPFWEALHAHGAELVLNGHDHSYERLETIRPDGTRDDAFGLRQIIAGTGGKNLSVFPQPPLAITAVRDNHHFGVLRLDLRSDGYDWAFVPVVEGGFADAGSGVCHGPPP